VVCQGRFAGFYVVQIFDMNAGLFANLARLEFLLTAQRCQIQTQNPHNVHGHVIVSLKGDGY
jgi:hypothetical protein